MTSSCYMAGVPGRERCFPLTWKLTDEVHNIAGRRDCSALPSSRREKESNFIVLLQLHCLSCLLTHRVSRGEGGNAGLCCGPSLEFFKGHLNEFQGYSGFLILALFSSLPFLGSVSSSLKWGVMLLLSPECRSEEQMR